MTCVSFVGSLAHCLAGLARLLIPSRLPCSQPASLWASFRRWRQGYFPALLYLLGCGVILGSVNLLLLRATGVVQPAAWNAYLFPLAVTAESILFSFALAYRRSSSRNGQQRWSMPIRKRARD